MNGPLHPGHLTQYGILDPRDLAARQKQIALEAIEYGNEFPGFLAPWDLPLKANAMMAAPVPILGDILGLAADAKMYATEPESRTLANFGMTAAGMLPFVPAAASSIARMAPDVARGAGDALDMSTEARMQRAREMGFDVDRTYYHGTMADSEFPAMPGEAPFEEFDRSLTDDYGLYFTTDKSIANEYTGPNGWRFDTKLRTEKPLVVDFIYQDGASLPTPMVDGKPLPFKSNDEIAKFAENSGFDSVIFPNGNFSEGAHTAVVFDPSQIRDVDAAFDPAKKDNANLLASLAGIGILSPAMLAAYQDDREQ